jgi:hypothetical protein
VVGGVVDSRRVVCGLWTVDGAPDGWRRLWKIPETYNTFKICFEVLTGSVNCG